MKRARMIVAVLLWAHAASAAAGDWPQWRYDSGHTAASPHELPDTLHRQWTRRYGPRRQAWQEPINDALMPYDKVFEPIVAGGRMFLGFNDMDKLVALDVATGAELWRFYAEGPVRMAPAAHDGKVFFASDDGFLYCLDAADGALLWKFRGGPERHKCLGNERIISAWPARGGPVVRDATVYFAAGIWPFMGTFLHAIDAATGDVVWVNDSTGEMLTDQPHVSLAFGGVAPQGTFSTTERFLLVPGGRGAPAGLDRATGKVVHFNNAGGDHPGGSCIVADDRHFYTLALDGVVTNRVDTGTSVPIRFDTPPVLDANGVMYVAEAGAVTALTLLHSWPADRPRPEGLKLPAREVLWEVEADGDGDLIRAGNRLYAAGAGAITAIDLPTDQDGARIAWQMPVQGEVLRLLAGNDRLFAVTRDGRILAFGAGDGPGLPVDHAAPAPRAVVETAVHPLVERLETKEGYALCFGRGAWVPALLENTRFQIALVEVDDAKVDASRRAWDDQGLYGTRISVHAGTPEDFKAPSYIAQLVTVARQEAVRCLQAGCFEEIYRSVRPYGGLLWLDLPASHHERVRRLVAEGGLAGAVVEPFAGGLLLQREGPLPGSADWTHQYGSMANTLKSDDASVKLPLGVLWFGGNSHVDVLPRHGNGPPQQIVEGRLIIQGLDSVSCRDVYTGRVLWRVDIPPEELGTFGVYYDHTMKADPLALKTQAHIPGARVRGTNFVATPEYVYVALADRCRVLDMRTGGHVRDLFLPGGTEGDPLPWGFIGVYGDVLFGGTGFTSYSGQPGLDKMAPAIDVAASKGLAAFDRFTGEVRWTVEATHGFVHNGIAAGNGRLYMLDVLPQHQSDGLRRRGLSRREEYRLLCLDVATGDTLWSRHEDIHGVFLSFSQARDLLLMSTDAQQHRLANLAGRVPWTGRARGITAFDARSGAVRWNRDDFEYDGPLILHNDLIFSNLQSNWRASGPYAGVLNLLDGSENLTPNPITGHKERWIITRNYGCNAAHACENLISFRSGASGFYDLSTRSGTGNFAGFRSGCTSNLIAAGGVLNAPDYTRSCSCAFQNQTSLALVHMPDLPTVQWTTQYTRRYWSNYRYRDRMPLTGPVQRVGLNLGAPGDRVSPEGVLWMEYPRVQGAWEGGDRYDLAVAMDGNAADSVCRSTWIMQGPMPWVGASFVRDIKYLMVDLNTGGENVTCTVKLYFAELDDIAPRELDQQGQKRGHRRQFNVEMQDELVMEDFDILEEAGERFTTVVKTFRGIQVRDTLKIRLSRTLDSRYPPVLNGVEILVE